MGPFRKSLKITKHRYFKYLREKKSFTILNIQARLKEKLDRRIANGVR